MVAAQCRRECKCILEGTLIVLKPFFIYLYTIVMIKSLTLKKEKNNNMLKNIKFTNEEDIFQSFTAPHVTAHPSR